MEEYNPWWRGVGGLREDYDLQKWGESPVRWTPRLLWDVLGELRPFSLHFIFGPRQVGKTTLLKLLVKALVEGGRGPRSIFYYSCDMLSDYRELEEVVRGYLKLKSSWGIRSALILLDEVTYPREWFRAIKSLVDRGLLSSDVVIATGSLSMVARRELEAFPGRRGYGRDFLMAPLSFRDFVRVARSDVPVDSGPDKLLGWLGVLGELLEKYLDCGGFPRSVVSCLSEGRVDAYFERDLLNSIVFDISRLRRSEVFAKRVARAIIEKAPNAFSLNSVAREYELRSHKVVLSYIDLFEKLFLARSLLYVDVARLVEDVKKERKVHFVDPLLYRVMSKWANVQPPSRSALLEATVAEHIARSYRAGYWRNRIEVDVVIPELGLGFEVKSRAGGYPKRLGKIDVYTATLRGVGGGSIPLPLLLVYSDRPGELIGYISQEGGL
ncbi:ATP-binding protein [Infirmifilum lucidum]|uniref:ATP-binding protein n=1 Tax=Infirmifilum lucidum TaxID=2776706 RepID=A0A7L9FJK2_9CREN|nr:ATP-binding protein [Infirmifilum lucidum]QOJ79066.1 ATP-binding protein [Infirmifilum lucidum]